MRFIVGLLIGIVATILITVDMDLAPLRDSALELMDDVASSSRPVADHAQGEVPDPAKLVPTPDTPDVLAQALAAAEAEVGAQATELVDAGSMEIETIERGAAGSDRIDGGPTDDADAGSVEYVLVEQVPVAPPSGEGVATIWTPFYSEISASGFANRLSLVLNQPFEVARSGAGRYSVTFVHDSVEDRDRVLDEVEALTGYRAR